MVDKWVLTQCQRRVDLKREDKRFHFPQHICGNPVLVVDRTDILETALCGSCLLLYGNTLPGLHSHGDFIHVHNSGVLWHNRKLCVGFASCEEELKKEPT